MAAQKKHQGKTEVIVLGAGASGMMAAIAAAAEGRRVLLLEQKEKAGKKIYATGNGKCNFTNVDMALTHFRGEQALIRSVLEQFGNEETLRFFHEIGVFPKCRGGYYYPYSQTASSVVRALEQELARLGVSVRTGVRTTEIVRTMRGFRLRTDEGALETPRVIIATGLLASPKLGSDGSAMELVKSLGHRFTPVVPALCGFHAEGMRFSEVAGVRTDVRIRLFVDGVEVAEDAGELQLTDYGISGIPVFQVSRYASLALREGRRVAAELDLFPELTLEAVENELRRRFQNESRQTFQNEHRQCFQCERSGVRARLNGLLNHKLFPSLFDRAWNMGDKCVEMNHRGDESAEELDSKQLRLLDSERIRLLAETMKAYPVTLTAPRGFEYAQVCAGGIREGEIDPVTLESRLHSGLFFCGEILNVDGICGGYNLQWAWSSGAVAGRNAGAVKTE